MTNHIDIRDARPEDAEFIAWVVQTALDIPEPVSQDIVRVCADTGTLYSWQHTRIVSVGGQNAGCLVSYRGDDYLGMREGTWQRCWPNADLHDLRDVAIEAFPGEYYLDSMSIKPEFRGLGLGKLLLLDGIEHARSKGCKSATLIVSVDKPHLQAYYQQVGFQLCGNLSFFGHGYNRMRHTI